MIRERRVWPKGEIIYKVIGEGMSQEGASVEELWGNLVRARASGTYQFWAIQGKEGLILGSATLEGGILTS